MGSLKDKATFTYIKKIKRWMFCPACGDKMRINRRTDTWECQKCDYTLSDKEFRSGYVFWFCDGCESFLNNQEGFDINADTWICKNCGFENDITADNIVDVCKDCGAKLPENATRSLCEDCRKLRHEKMVKRLETGSEMAGVVAVVAKVVRDAMQEGDNSLSLNYESLEPDIDYPVCKSCGAKMTEFDGCAWYTCPECGDAVKIVDGVMTWQNEIFGRGIRNSGKTCSNCGKSLDGGSYTAPWENGSNPDGYIKCPYCGFINFQGEGCM